MFGISVIICCYNSTKRLPKTLEHLSNQYGLVNTEWEVLVINNNSSDDTEGVAEHVWQNCGNVAELKIIRESIPGLTNARIAGVKNSKFDFIIFCDDDNWLDSDYLLNVKKLFIDHPDVGVIGPTKVSPFYEVDKPLWLKGYENLLCIFDVEIKHIIITPNSSKIFHVAGAGMAIKKNIMLEYITSVNKSPLRRQLDRSPLKNLSGGDDDINETALKLGSNLLLTEKLHLTHFIPLIRLNQSYILNLYEGMNYSSAILYFLNHNTFPKGWSPLGLISNICTSIFNPFKLQLIYRGMKGRRLAKKDLIIPE
jgi:glycosyltransferase involved in cell wall biosynthesis